MTTKHTPAMPLPNAADAFYAAPSPSLAVALAIADHKALNKFPMWEYVEQLQKAQDRSDAYPLLVEALRRSRELWAFSDDFIDQQSEYDKTWNSDVDALLRSLGEAE